MFDDVFPIPPKKPGWKSDWGTFCRNQLSFHGTPKHRTNIYKRSLMFLLPCPLWDKAFHHRCRLLSILQLALYKCLQWSDPRNRRQLNPWLSLHLFLLWQLRNTAKKTVQWLLICLKSSIRTNLLFLALDWLVLSDRRASYLSLLLLPIQYCTLKYEVLYAALFAYSYVLEQPQIFIGAVPLP